MSRPEPTDNFRNFLTSNLTGAALVKEHEAWLAEVKRPLVELRTIPREQWPECYGRDVTLPPEIQRYLDGREPGPMSKDEVQGMEIAVERYHGVAEPDYISMSPKLQASGQAWSFVAEAAPYMSGFEFSNTGA